MKKYSLIPSLLLVMMAACTQKEQVSVVPAEDPVVAEQPVPVTYIYANGTETKASVDGTSGAFTWNTKDRIAVYTTDGYKLSDELASTYNGTNSATFSFTGDHAITEANRTDLAIFPASLVFNETSPGVFVVRTATASDHMVITLPASYKLAQVQDNVTPTPKIATNAPDGGLSFKSICALVRITVNNISKDASYLKVTFPGKKVQGEFILTNEMVGTAGVVTDGTDGTDDTITITDLGISAFTSGLVINVPVPTGVADSKEYTDVVIGAYDANNQKIHSICTPVKAQAWAPSRTAARKVTANLPVFTVSNSKKVVFAPGNLRAVLGAEFTTDEPSYASSWSFAAHQYDAIGNNIPAGRTHSVNSFVEANVGDVFDLFAWFGSGATNFNENGSYYSDDPEENAAFEKYKYGIIRLSSKISGFTGNTSNEAILLDWGHNEISDAVGAYPADTWRTPSPDDWNSAVLTRENHIFLRATITDASPVAYGLIIAPDQYTHPSGVTEFSNTNASGGACSDNTYTMADWAKLEAAGCVFLPITNHRQKSGDYSATVWPADGVYWTNKGGTSSKGCAFLFTDTTLGSGMETSNQIKYQKGVTTRYYGCAVRLVRDVN